MSTNDNDEHDSNAALAVAAIGGGAVLLWLFLRGRGKGWGLGGNRTNRWHGNGPVPDADLALARPTVCIWLRDGNRLDINGVRTDLETAVTIARTAGKVYLLDDGAVTQGLYVKVKDALRDAGVTFATASPWWDGQRVRAPSCPSSAVLNLS